MTTEKWLNSSRSKFLYDLLDKEIPWNEDDQFCYSDFRDILDYIDNYWWGPYDTEDEDVQIEPLAVATRAIRQLSERLYIETNIKHDCVIITKGDIFELDEGVLVTLYKNKSGSLKYIEKPCRIDLGNNIGLYYFHHD